MKRWMLAGVLALCGGAALAALPSPAPQVPMTDAERALVDAVYRRWYVPQAQTFAQQADGLVQAMAQACAAPATPSPPEAPLEAGRAQWRRTVQAWERLSAVRGGALLARRSPRAIDFTPTRPEAIQRAIEAEPADARAMERIGAPAKGLPALEWLLWVRPVQPGTAGCRYAQHVAAEVAAEAHALQAAYRHALAHGWDDADTEYAVYEFLNLFDAGVQKLWWEDMDRPLQKMATGARHAAPARSASGMVVLAWQTHWQALDSLHELLAQYLVAKGRQLAADELDRLFQSAGREMQALPADGPAPPERAAVSRAVAPLRALQRFIEGDMAHALQFVIAFFDEDGD